jgi:hypothetical protein
MAIGPVQLLVLGFDSAEFHCGIVQELERLRETGTVRVIDALAVPLCDAIARAGGFPISDGMISPYDLVAIGLATTEEARQLQQGEKRVAPVSSS